MRVLPFYVGAAAIAAIGGAVAGGAIDTTPREIHQTPVVPERGAVAFNNERAPRAITANHHPLETQGRTIEVAELRERGLYSQERYDHSYYGEQDGNDSFDFASAADEQRQWEAEQRRATTQRQRIVSERRVPAARSLDLQRPAKVADADIAYVSRPVVQDTTSLER